MKLVIRPAAAADIRAAREYYEGERAGLGDELAVALDQLFERLEVFPRSAAMVAGYGPVRRAPLRRFPYTVFYRYRLDDDAIHVLRIVHTARSAEGWPTSRP